MSGFVTETKDTCAESPAEKRNASPKEKPAKSTALGTVSSRVSPACAPAGVANNTPAAAAKAARRRLCNP